MEDDKQIQNPGEPELDQSTNATLDTLLGGEDTKPEGADTAKEDKKQQDFEKAFFKEKEAHKAAKARVKELEASKPAVPTESDPQVDAYLTQLMENAAKSAIEPYVGHLQEQGQKALVDEFRKENEYADVLAQPILINLREMGVETPTKKDLNIAYALALKDNLPTIINTSAEVGRQAGFKNRSFKRAQGSINETPNRPTGDNSDQFERYQSGELTDEEYKELRQDGTLEKWDMEQLA